MMSEFDQLIAEIYADPSQQNKINAFYLSFLKSSLFVPIEDNESQDPEEFMPLFLEEEDNYFLMVFDSKERLLNWADEQVELTNYAVLSGKGLINGLGENIYLELNYGNEFYKEFSPDEVIRLKGIITNLERLAK